ncbi:DNA recombination-mediator protein A [compost metagenome]
MRVAIIGSRLITASEYELLTGWAEELTSKGHEVSTGAAPGADTAAMDGASVGDVTKLHVFLPWKSFSAGSIPKGAVVTVYNSNLHPEWTESVRLHPKYYYLKKTVKPLHARNYGIVAHPKPVDAVIALPRSLSDWGGTGQGMRVAEHLGITLYNLRVTGVIKEVDNWIHNL